MKPGEYMLAFDFQEYVKHPQRLRHWKGTKAIASQVVFDDCIAVKWAPSISAIKPVQIYTPRQFMKELRLQITSVREKFRTWMDVNGKKHVWNTVDTPTVTEFDIENREGFLKWVGGVLEQDHYLTDEVKQASMVIADAKSSDNNWHPMSMSDWPSRLKTMPDFAWIRVKHMQWFFGVNVKNLNAMIKKGKAPAPSSQQGYIRYWKLSEVVKFKENFSPEALACDGTAEV